MELLKKTVAHKVNRKEDNSDKRPLFAKLRHPKTAAEYQKEWSFITDGGLRENISYQMQYLEFQVKLYNDYQIYLTIESLLCKDILSTIASIVEAALFDVIHSAKGKAGMSAAQKTDFVSLLGEAYHSFRLIDKETWSYFHELRKVRNFIHLSAADFQEHTAYTIEETNEAIQMLERLRLSLSK